MTDPVALPWWLFVLLCIFAAVATVDRIAAPSVRWFFRRRFNQAIDELNQRLDMRIQPFRLTRRQTHIDRLIYDSTLIEAIDQIALETGTPRAVLMKQAERYAREIVPAYSVTTYFGFGIRAARWISQFVYRVRLGYSDDAALKSIDSGASVVFVMNHRSNMDYVLVTYMASSRASLSYAAGEWARIFLLQSLIRSMGAYFIRRDSGDQLYRKVLGRYVGMATREGVTQAVFPEGGLSRDGRLRDPKLGLISYMVADFDPQHMRDIVFVPVGINYDRVIEDRILTSKIEKAESGRNFSVRPTAIFGFVANLIKLRLQGRLYRYGYACVSFGHPISLTQWSKENGIALDNAPREALFEATEKLGQDLIGSIGKIVPVLPVAMVAKTMLDNGDEWIGELEVKSRVFELTEHLESIGAHVHVPRADRDYAVSTGLRMLSLRHLIETNDEGLVRANPGEHVLLAYYANSLAHLLEDAPHETSGGAGSAQV